MRRSILSVPAALVLVAAAMVPAAAQDTSHPAGVHVGTCPVPGNLVVSLWDASPNFLVDGETDAGEALGSRLGSPVAGSVTVVEMPLADLVATEHAILVHRSQAEMDDYLVCGDIGGVMMGPDELAVALAPVGPTQWSGSTILDDEGNGTTTVSMYVFEGPGIDTGAEDIETEPFPSPSPLPEETFDDGIDAARRAVQPDKADKADKDAKEDKDKDDKDKEVDVCHFPGHDGDFVTLDDAVLELRCEGILGGNVITIGGNALDAHVAP